MSAQTEMRLHHLVDVKVVADVVQFDGQDHHWQAFSRDFEVAVSNLGLDELMRLTSTTTEDELHSSD